MLVFPLVVLVFPLLVLVFPLVVLVFPLAVLVCPLVVLVCPLAVLSVGLFITDLINGDKYFFFIKVVAANVLLKLNYRKIIFLTPNNIKHFIERLSVTY